MLLGHLPLSYFWLTFIDGETVLLHVQARNILYNAFIEIVGVRREALRDTETTLKVSTAEDNQSNIKLINLYRENISKEILRFCDTILSLVQNINTPQDDIESKLFEMRITADCWRYRAEFEVGEALEEAKYKAEQEYAKALELSRSLAPTHSVRLGVSLNYSVYCFEIEHNSKKAYALAKKAITEAMSDLEPLPEESLEDFMTITKLIRENMALW
eukprot:TRINITY_DN1739_c0_g1_i2.p1 TRINITY_DN1739_c0_g1~~TRINITY_DN1739_c0_g1_i2.p1  ORF type:complete len:216 (-),score=41.80 TRINITY_DN1739_c0_g1_i2:94-741(-)